MNHIKITQENGQFPEPINWQVLEELGDSLSSLDNESNIIGSVRLDHAYEDTCTTLRTAFEDFIINVTGEYYLRFQDPLCQQMCATQWGTNGVMTLSQAAAVSEIPGQFFAYSNITSFDELSEFGGNTGVQISSQAFRNCPNLTSVDLKNVTFMQSGIFQNSPNLAIDVNMPRLTYAGDYIFSNTGVTSVSNLGSITVLYQNSFSTCPNLTSVTLPVTCTVLDSSCFYNCTSLRSVSGLERLQSIGRFCFARVKLDAFPLINVTTAYNGLMPDCKCDYVYLPKLIVTDPGSSFRNSWTARTFFTDGHNETLQADVVYFRDITKFYTADFALTKIKALVINNTTPPAWANTNDVSDADAETSNAYEAHKGKMFYNSDITAIYVPDSAVSTYQADPYWGGSATVPWDNTVKYNPYQIKPISELNGGVTYNTRADWEEAGKPVALITEYM